MNTIRCKRTIRAEPAVVYAALCDLKNAPSRIPAILKLEVLTDGPVGKGTRFRETRRMFGREATEVMEIVGFEPPRSMTLGAESHGCRYRTEYRLTPVAGGTELELDFQAEGLNWFSRLMGRLMRPMMKKMAELCSKDLEALAKSIEKA